MSGSGLGITVEFLHGRYDAESLSPRQPEWPPHPARLFCALVAAAGEERSPAQTAALEWLESLPAPVVVTSNARSQVIRSYQPLNTLLGAEERRRLLHSTETWLADRHVAFWWPTEIVEAHVDTLASLAPRVPYLGRSTSPVLVSLATGPCPAGEYRWAEQPEGRERVRVPRRGYLSALDDAHRQGWPAWRVRAHQGWYEQSPNAERGLWGDLEIFELDPAPPGDWVLRVAEAARASVLSRLPADAPAEVTGHCPKRPHPAFLPLPVVGHRHARGHLRGLAVAYPAYLGDEERALLAGAVASLVADRWTLRLPGGVETAVTPAATDAAVLRTRTWRGPAKEWVTATPVVLDRWPKRAREDAVAKVLRRSLADSGYPEPAEIRVSRAPTLTGAARVDRDLLTRQDGRGGELRRPVVWCTLRFSQAVRGPVLLGALRHFGVGLCRPCLS